MRIIFTVDDRNGGTESNFSLADADNGKAILIYAEVHDQKLTPSFAAVGTIAQIRNGIDELAAQLNAEMNNHVDD